MLKKLVFTRTIFISTVMEKLTKLSQIIGLGQDYSILYECHSYLLKVEQQIRQKHLVSLSGNIFFYYYYPGFQVFFLFFLLI